MSIRRRAARPGLLILAALVFASCGYRPVAGTVPGREDRVFVPVVKNRSAYPGLAAPLTAALRRRLATGGVKVANDAGGAARLEVVILAADGEPGMVGVSDGRLAPVDAIWRLSAEARLLGPSGEAIATPEPFEVEGRALATDSVAGEEALGQRRRVDLLDDLADAIVSSLFE